MDRGVLKELFDMYWEELYNLCVLLGVGYNETTDIVADAFVALHRKSSQGLLEGNDNIHSFLLTTVREMSLKQLKKEAWELANSQQPQ